LIFIKIISALLDIHRQVMRLVFMWHHTY